MPTETPRTEARGAAPHRRSSPEAPNLLTRLRARSRAIDGGVAVHERVGAVGGGTLSSAIALAAFLSLFPLLVVGIAVMGFLSAGNVDFADDVVDELGLEGDIADTVLDAIHTAERSRHAATILGLAGLAWSGLAVAGALQATLNAAWQVKGRGLIDKLRAAGWIAGLGVVFLASTAVTPLIAGLSGPAIVPSLLLTLAIDTVVLLSMFRFLTNVRVSWQAHLPGAVLAAVGLGVLKMISGTYVPRLVESSSLWGTLGVVFALLIWFLLLSRLVIYGAALNVVTHERRHGTVTAEIDVPRIEGEIPLETTRGGAVDASVRAAERAGVS